MQGWIKLFYQFKDWEWYGDTNMVRLFIHLLLTANYRLTKWRGMEIPRGSLLTSRSRLVDETGLSAQTIRTCLTRLKSTNEITVNSTNKYTIITLCNYEKYQEIPQETNQQNNQQTNHPITNNQPTTNQQSTSLYIKEYKNIRNKEYNNIIIQEPKGDHSPFSSGAEAPEAPEPPKEEKKPQEKPKKKKQATIPFAKIKDLWNELCPAYPKMMVMSEARKNKIRLRIQEMGGIEKALPTLEKIFKAAENSNFMKGDNKRGWKASFDWIFENDKNWVKVWEGNYDNKTQDTYPTTTQNRNYNGNTEQADRFSKRRGVDTTARSAEDYTGTL